MIPFATVMASDRNTQGSLEPRSYFGHSALPSFFSAREWLTISPVASTNCGPHATDEQVRRHERTKMGEPVWDDVIGHGGVGQTGGQHTAWRPAARTGGPGTKIGRRQTQRAECPRNLCSCSAWEWARLPDARFFVWLASSRVRAPQKFCQIPADTFAEDRE